MTDKAYIVANEQQEREVLEKLEQEGLKWRFKSKPTEWVPTRKSYFNIQFPYVLFDDDGVTWGEMSELEDDYEIVYDGRKEEQMSDKYVVSQEFMNTLKLWREYLPSFSMSKKFVGPTAIEELDDIVDEWWNTTELSGEEQNNRLIAIIRWVNGEDVFEVEKPKKWLVRSKETDIDGAYLYATLRHNYNITDVRTHYGENHATRFDTKEEAESWANSHQEVIQVESE